MPMNQGEVTVSENKSKEIPLGWILIGIGIVTTLIMTVVFMLGGV